MVEGGAGAILQVRTASLSQDDRARRLGAQLRPDALVVSGRPPDRAQTALHRSGDPPVSAARTATAVPR